jgi:Tol biopolymer transport system component
VTTVAQLSAALAGRYEIQREIGRGGMAVVYLARDARHNRNVALKVLNPELGAVLGSERFLAEIQVTANLQHPNLLPLFDSGEANGLLFYVMPYVEGESLRKRLSREKQLPIEEAIRIASSVAHALDYAHRHQVIHRDLKPENILMHEGQPLIADFGIALAVSNAGGARITQTGLSLGTPQYMSPEQATGDRVVDGRADIYSLGAMTYEMLVGDPPHTASTSQAIIAKVLTERPTSVRTIRPNVLPHVDAAIERALEKLAADRYHTAREFADALEGRGLSTSAAIGTGERVVPGKRRPRILRRLREVLAWSLAAALLASLAWQQFQAKPGDEAPVIRANLDMPPGTRVNDVLAGTTIAVSPKGDVIAFITTNSAAFRIWIRRINELNAREVSGSAGRNLTFSPDGRWLAFTEGNVLKKVSVDGGEIMTIGTTGGSVPYGLAWTETDTIYVGSFQGMWGVPAGGGSPSPIGARDTSSGTGQRVGQRWPMILPSRKTIAYTTGSGSSVAPSRLAIYTMGSGEVTEVDLTIAAALGMLHDHLVYVNQTGGLMAVRFDEASRQRVGEPIQLEDGILVDPTSGAKASLSPSGTLAYLRGRAQFQPVLARAGSSAPVAFLRESGSFSTPRISPEGRRVAMTVFAANATDIWIYDFVRNTFTRLTTEGWNVRPEWTPDGRDVLFISTRGNQTGIWRQPADGSGPAELFYQPEVEPFEALMSPDTNWLIVRTAPGAKYPRDILAVNLRDERKVTPIVSSPYTESLPRLSPDGKWLAYQSNESGRFEIYVRPFPARGARVQVSDNGGTEAVWGRSGRSLYYRNATGETMEVTVTTGSSFSIGERRMMLPGDYLMDASHANYDVAADGRFLLLKRAGAESQTIVVHNWGRELKEKTTRRN